ncbi:MAG: glutamate--tRNA ligase [Deltaproteobacteria bacterium]|nr:glutamate--tRNA ligase [Deltaproteobacteria bacterium]
MTNDKVRTRFAPSPTGFLHIGGARTALFNWLYTRRCGGTFVLRIEDTDQARSTDESTRAILDAMAWLGLKWDEGPYFQAERVGIHREMVQKLIDEGKAYYCTCSPEALEAKRKKALAEGRKPKYDGTCRDRGLNRSPESVVRFRCPDVGVTVMRDLIKGAISFSNEELDDLIIERADGYPTYNFAVVVDDAQMGITHVIRGDDHVNNTPKQMLIYEALGCEVPLFGHVPMILGSDKARLSKRHGATSVMAYQEMGYLPEALVNYLVRLGWSHGDQEIFTMEELIREFSLEAVVTPFWEKKGFDVSDGGFVAQAAANLRTRSKTRVEMADSGSFFFQEEVDYNPEAAAKFLTPEYAGHLEAVVARIPDIVDYTKDGLEIFLRALAEERGTKLKWIAQALRVALTGKTVSPGIDEVMVTLGKERVIRKIRRAIDQIKAGG